MKNRKTTAQNSQFPKRRSQLGKVQRNLNQNKLASQAQSTKTVGHINKRVIFPCVNNSKREESQNYLLNEIIGEGAFAKVRKSCRKSDGLACVIKSYQKLRMSSQQKRRSIWKQIQILKTISHPNVIRIIDSYQNSQTINIVMQDFSNCSLAVFVKQHRPLQQEMLRSITRSVAAALVYLHSEKISHRDLKPQNILINSEGAIKIIDLGLAMMGDHNQMLVAGTPQFMCPQLISKHNFNPYKADVWAFGILLYWIVLGYYPQDNCKKWKSLRKMGNFQLKFPIDMHPGIQYLIQRMLELDPQFRIQAQEILQDSWVKPRNIKLQISKLIKLSKA